MFVSTSPGVHQLQRQPLLPRHFGDTRKAIPDALAQGTGAEFRGNRVAVSWSSNI